MRCFKNFHDSSPVSRSQHFGFVEATCRNHAQQRRPAFGQGAGLVDDEGIDLLQAFERLRALDKHAGLGTAADATSATLDLGLTERLRKVVPLDVVLVSESGIRTVEDARRMREMFGGDPFPFGIEANRPTLEQFLRYTHEQGIAHRHAKVEEIFPKGMMVEVHT